MLIHAVLAIFALLIHSGLRGTWYVMLMVNAGCLLLAFALNSFVMLGFLQKININKFAQKYVYLAIGGMCFFLLWAAFWSIGEQALIDWCAKNKCFGDMGSSYFYHNDSGMGYAKGLRGIGGRLLWLGGFGLLLSLIACPFWYLGFLARKQQEASSTSNSFE
jgi:hypothetical protein